MADGPGPNSSEGAQPTPIAEATGGAVDQTVAPATEGQAGAGIAAGEPWRLNSPISPPIGSTPRDFGSPNTGSADFLKDTVAKATGGVVPQPVVGVTGESQPTSTSLEGLANQPATQPEADRTNLETQVAAN